MGTKRSADRKTTGSALQFEMTQRGEGLLCSQLCQPCGWIIERIRVRAAAISVDDYINYDRAARQQPNQSATGNTFVIRMRGDDDNTFPQLPQVEYSGFCPLPSTKS